jgi:hypothetical protein
VTFAGFVALSVWLVFSGGTEVSKGDKALFLASMPVAVLLTVLTIGALISPAYLSLDEKGFTSYSLVSGVTTGRWTECGPFHSRGQSSVWCDPRRLDPPQDWRARAYRRRHSKRFRIPQAMADLRGTSGLISNAELERILNNYRTFYGRAVDGADYGTPSTETRRQDCRSHTAPDLKPPVPRSFGPTRYHKAARGAVPLGSTAGRIGS